MNDRVIPGGSSPKEAVALIVQERRNIMAIGDIIIISFSLDDHVVCNKLGMENEGRRGMQIKLPIAPCAIHRAGACVCLIELF